MNCIEKSQKRVGLRSIDRDKDAYLYVSNISKEMYLRTCHQHRFATQAKHARKTELHRGRISCYPTYSIRSSPFILEHVELAQTNALIAHMEKAVNIFTQILAEYNNVSK